MTEEKEYQYWLAKVDKYGTGWCGHGPFDDEQGVNKEYYLHKRLGFAKEGDKYAIAKVELLSVSEDKQNINEEAANTCKEMLDQFSDAT